MRQHFWICLPLLLVGCSKPTELVGQWKYGLERVEFKPDHTFVQKAKHFELTGIWTRSGGVVTMTPTSISGKTLDQFRLATLNSAKKSDKARLNATLKQILSTNQFKMNEDGITMDIVDRTGQRKDSMLRIPGTEELKA